MRTLTRYLYVLFAFGLVLGTIYWLITKEWTGSILLWTFSLTPLIIAVYATRHGALSTPSPQDDPDASPTDDPGEDLGTFPAASVWPIFLVSGVVLTGASLIYGLILLVVGLPLIAWAVIGFMRESRT